MQILLSSFKLVLLLASCFVVAAAEIGFLDILNAIHDDPELDFTDAAVIVKRMADEVMQNSPNAVIISTEPITTHNISYGWDEHQHKQVGMLVDGKPVVMGAYSTNDPANGVTTMTVYMADKNGFKSKASYSYRRKIRDENKLKSLVG